MNIQISGKNFELTDAIKAYAEEKIGSVSRLADNIIELRVVLEHTRTQHASTYHATGHIHVSHDDIHSEVTHTDVYAAIDELKDEIVRQLRDRKSKYAAQNRKSQQTQRDLKSAL